MKMVRKQEIVIFGGVSRISSGIQLARLGRHFRGGVSAPRICQIEADPKPTPEIVSAYREAFAAAVKEKESRQEIRLVGR